MNGNSIYPEKPLPGGKCYALRMVRPHNDEAADLVPAFLAVDPDTGRELQWGRIFEVRNGGGHNELKGFLQDPAATGLERAGSTLPNHATDPNTAYIGA